MPGRRSKSRRSPSGSANCTLAVQGPTESTSSGAPPSVAASCAGAKPVTGSGSGRAPDDLTRRMRSGETVAFSSTVPVLERWTFGNVSSLSRAPVSSNAYSVSLPSTRVSSSLRGEPVRASSSLIQA